MTDNVPKARRREAWSGALVVALVTAIAFVPALSAGFVTWDDDTNFLNNTLYRGLGGSQLHWMWTTTHMGHYVPLSWMTLGFDYLVWGMNPAGYHLTNVILHTANAVVVYWIARRILRLAGAAPANAKPWLLTTVSVIAALIFAIHPLRVESVVWITERRDVLSGLFGSLATLMYLRAAESNRRGGSYWCSVALFAAALLSKATVVTLPAIFAILNIYPLRRLGSGGRWWTDTARAVYRELAPFMVLAAGASAMTFVALQHVDQLPPDQKIAVSAYSLSFYLWKTIEPFRLAPLYKMPANVVPTAPVFLASYALAIAVSVGAWRARRRWPAMWLGWIAFVVILLPMLGFHQNGPQITADRYTYHASPVLGILIAGAIAAAADSVSLGMLVPAAVVLLALGALTWRQAELWHDSERMWTQVLAVDERSSVAHTALANLLLKRNDVIGAVAHYEQSLAIDPGSPEAHDNLGVAFARQGRFAEAAVQFRETIRFRPTDYEAENDLGAAMVQMGEVEGAIEHYARALSIKADFADAQINWGNALTRLNRPSDAIVHYEAAVKSRPNSADAERNWGVALAQQGKFAEGIVHFRRAIDIRSDDNDAKEYLVRATAALGRQRSPAR